MTAANPLSIAGRETQNELASPGPREITTEEIVPESLQATGAIRRRLPDERRGVTHHFSVAGQEGYLTVGVYEDGRPGELFIRMAKEGSTISGLMDAFATAVSLALQYGVPLEVLCGKFTHMRFEPSGWSGNAKIGYAHSLVDYIFRWLEMKFLNREQGELFQYIPLPPERPSESERKCG
jgi:ribonucleoside-diphosphate reductase alpha chain